MERYLGGLSMRKIAAELGVSVWTVHNDLAVVRKVWREEMAAEYEIWKDRELERIDKLELAAWDGWQRSLQDAVKISERMVPVGNGSERVGVEQTMETKGQAGDPSFLAVIAKCIEQRCKILGLYAPVRKDVTQNGVSVKYVIGIDQEQI
jgi:hypothetical protein